MRVKLLLSFLLIPISIVAQELTPSQANRLAELPLKCIEQEYPNKLNQVLKDASQLDEPAKLHPAFFGCFDWHSSVHGHWSLVYLSMRFPNLEEKQLLLEKLSKRITKEHIAREIEYFQLPNEKSFERTYGWSWLLKLQHELAKSHEPALNMLAQNLQPLTDLLVERYKEFLPKLLYPVRAGTHTNTAFGLNFAWDYAVFSNRTDLQEVIKTEALRLYASDRNCPLNWEPSGTDFLSPCLEEAALMARLLSKDEFLSWSKEFLPQLFNTDFDWEVARVSDRTDGHLVHLDGLNFSRAWNLYFLAGKYPGQFLHLERLADKHLLFSLPSLTDGNYEGEHWLASFVLHAFERKAQIE
ncbi:MAG: DUF2891 domain-containing protein [Flavobacteriaceae bacterium]|nr:DUF2891 domain-containing protein [Flavobacteriaceae bacterium]